MISSFRPEFIYVHCKFEYGIYIIKCRMNILVFLIKMHIVATDQSVLNGLFVKLNTVVGVKVTY